MKKYIAAVFALFFILAMNIGIRSSWAGNTDTGQHGNADYSRKSVATEKPAGFTVTSPTLKNGQIIPQQYTGDGKDISPALNWSAVPSQAKSLAIICSDPDAPSGTWYHWILFNMPPSTKMLLENVQKNGTLANGAEQGMNDFGKIGYNGPAPPPGTLHHYHFRLLALDKMLDLKPGIRKDMLLSSIKGHIIMEAEIVGIYHR